MIYHMLIGFFCNSHHTNSSLLQNTNSCNKTFYVGTDKRNKKEIQIINLIIGTECYLCW